MVINDMNTAAIVQTLYPRVKKTLSAPNGVNKFKQAVSRYFNKRNKEMHDSLPCSMIYYTAEEKNDLLRALDITEPEIAEVIKHTYYGKITNFSPVSAKDEVTILCMCIVKYFYDIKDRMNLELASIYLAFTPKMYPSVFFGSYPKFYPSEYRHVMEYVVNNMLNEKSLIKKEKSVFKAVKVTVQSWIDGYNELFNEYDDENIVYLINQIYDRLKAFTVRIAVNYYEAYNNKEAITYDSDNLNDDAYRLADSDSLRTSRQVEKAVSELTTTNTDLSICKYLSDSNVKAGENRAIMDGILGNNKNIKEIRELCDLIVSDYMAHGKAKDISNINFVAYSLTPKPNSKNKDIVRIKDIIEGWLDNSDSNYRLRKGRSSTKNSYYRAVVGYFTLMIYNTNK